MSGDANRSPYGARVDAAYSDAFLIKLGQTFEFDAVAPEFAQEVRAIGRRYFMDKGLEADDDARKEERADYQRLEDGVDRLSELLNRPEYADLASDMHIAALELQERSPQTDFSELSEFQKGRGEPYFLELLRLLNVLRTAAQHNAERLAPERGRKASFSLRNFVRRVADTWIDTLGRKFTVDAHKGAGVTPSFDFVHMLLVPLDAEITETRIVSAVRAEKERRRQLKAKRAELDRK